MKIARLLGLALIAVVAVSAMSASTASAIPKFKLPITKRGFAGLSGPTTWRNPVTGRRIRCEHDHEIGFIVGVTQLFLVWLLLNCTVTVGANGPCTIQSVGAPAAGLIQSDLLTALLGLLHQPEGGAGVLDEPTTGHVFFTLAATGSPCNTAETAFEGSVAGEYSPTGKRQSTAKVVFAPVSETGKQKITLILTLSGIVKPKLTGFEVEEETQESTEEITYEEAVEVD